MARFPFRSPDKHSANRSVGDVDDPTGEKTMNMIQAKRDPLLLAIENVIARSRPVDRDIILAVRFEDASYEELAVRHGISVKAVEKSVARMITRILLAGRPRWWQFWLR